VGYSSLFGTGFAQFGYAMVMTNTTLLASAMYTPLGSNGGVYVYSFTAPPSSQFSLQQLLSGSGSMSANFGVSIAAYGSMAAVGAPAEKSGLVYVYNLKATLYTQQQVLVNPLGTTYATGGNFGYRVALSSTMLVATNPSPSSSYLVGYAAVYAFVPSTGTFSYTQTLLPSSPTSTATGYYSLNNPGAALFGYGLAMTNSTLVIGAPYENAYAGAVYVYTLVSSSSPSISNSFSLQQKIFPPVFFTRFGYSVDVNVFGTLVVGAPANVYSGIAGTNVETLPPSYAPGSVYIFEQSVSSGFTNQARLSAERTGYPQRAFGSIVKLSANGSIILVSDQTYAVHEFHATGVATAPYYPNNIISVSRG